MARYYLKFCKNFSGIALPLTLSSKKYKFVWTLSCQKSFEKIKPLLCSDHVLKTPEFSERFSLAVDASDVGIGSVLLQVDSDNIEYSVTEGVIHTDGIIHCSFTFYILNFFYLSRYVSVTSLLS